MGKLGTDGALDVDGAAEEKAPRVDCAAGGTFSVACSPPGPGMSRYTEKVWTSGKNDISYAH